MSQLELTLGTNIKRLCDERKKSVRQIEREAGVASRTINRWDDNFPSIDKVAKVAVALGVSMDELVFGEKNPATSGDGDKEKRIMDFVNTINQLTDEQVSALLLVARTFLTDQ